MNSKILVTGASGFLGNAVVHDLLKQNYSIVATGRNLAKLKFDPSENLTIKKAELSNEDEVKPLLEGCTAIIHCAALAAPWGNKKDFYLSNVLSTKLLCKHALLNKVQKFVHISTPSIYMGMQKKIDISESDPIVHTHTSEYAITKKKAEEIVDNYYSKGLPVITLRPQGLFGPNDPTIMPRLIKINDKIGIPLINSGKHKIDLTYIDNVVHAISLALNAAPLCYGQKYNITNDEPVEFQTFIVNIFEQMKVDPKFKKFPNFFLKYLAKFLETFYKISHISKEPPITSYAVDALSESRTLSIEAAKKQLGYQPIVSLENGIKQYAEWWRLQT